MKRKIWLLSILIFLGLCIYGSVYASSFVIDLAKEPQAFVDWITGYGIFAQLVMMALVFLQVVFAWLPGEVFEVVAGYAFGFLQGSLIVLLGSLCASACIMILVKLYGQKLISLCFRKHDIHELPFLKDTKKVHKFIAIAFLIPGSPKDILTYAIGLTDMKISHFLCISTLARIPSVVTSTFTGSALGLENYTLALASFSFTLIISGIGILVYRYIANEKGIPIKEKIQK